ADAEPAAERGDSQAAILLALELAAPPFAPRLATCRRSESDHDRSPGDGKWGSGIEATICAKDGLAERLRRGGRPCAEAAARETPGRVESPAHRGLKSSIALG